MREIKFRAWDEKEMIYFDDLYWFEEEGVREIQDGIAIGAYKKYPLMQFTGLKDKTGKEIYEGDILEIDKNEFFDPNGIRYLQKGKHRFIMCGEDFNDFPETHFEYAEIIGNIYENPELLEGDNNDPNQ